MDQIDEIIKYFVLNYETKKVHTSECRFLYDRYFQSLQEQASTSFLTKAILEEKDCYGLSQYIVSDLEHHSYLRYSVLGVLLIFFVSLQLKRLTNQTLTSHFLSFLIVASLGYIAYDPTGVEILEHILILILSRSAYIVNVVDLLPIVLALLLFRLDYLPLLIGIIVYAINQQYSLGIYRIRFQSVTTALYFAFIVGIITVFAIFQSSAAGLIQYITLELHRYMNLTELHFVPSYGVLWYFHGLILEGYHNYFTYLLQVVPFVCAISLSQVVTVPADLNILIQLIIISVEFFSLKPKVINIAIAVSALLTRNTHIVRSMRNLNVILAGILVPILISPTIFALWVDYGTANANFLFFQGLASWAFLAFFTSEFLIAYNKYYDVGKSD